MVLVLSEGCLVLVLVGLCLQDQGQRQRSDRPSVTSQQTSNSLTISWCAQLHAAMLQPEAPVLVVHSQMDDASKPSKEVLQLRKTQFSCSWGLRRCHPVAVLHIETCWYAEGLAD
jgi:hypothetical protein